MSTTIANTPATGRGATVDRAESAHGEHERPDRLSRREVDALVDDRDGVNWPENTPISLMVTTDDRGGAVEKPFLVATAKLSTDGAGSWYGALRCRSPQATQLGALHVEPEPDASARETIDHARTLRDEGRIDDDELAEVERRARLQSRTIRLRGRLWNWGNLQDAKYRQAPPVYLECFDNWGKATTGGYDYHEQVGLRGERTDGTPRIAKKFDPERSLFTYDFLGTDDMGRPRVALRCCHGKYLMLHHTWGILIPYHRVDVGDPGTVITISEPCSATVEIIETERPEMALVNPKIDYRSTVTNPSDRDIDKEFTFEHAKSLSGEHRIDVGHSVSVGAKISYDAGGFGAEASMSYGFTHQESWGRTTTEQTTVSDSATIRVPPHTELDIAVVVKQAKARIPYTYVVHRRDLGGNALPDSPPCRAVYENVETLSTEVRVDRIRELPPTAEATA